jgi:hypothetical protein
MDIGMENRRRKRKLNETRDVLLMSNVGQRFYDNDPSSHYRINLFIPVLDRFIEEMTRRFTPEAISMTKAVQALVNVDYVNFLEFEDMNAILKILSEPLDISASLLKSELIIAKRLLSSRHSSITTFQDVLTLLSDDGSFHNLRLCMRAALTIPVTSASCERSFSSLKYIKNYLRNKMCNERLTALALLYISSTRASALETNVDVVIDMFGNEGKRSVQF